jgi:hypothetical protein
MASFNVIPEDPTSSGVFGELDLLLVKNDASDYYVPSFDVDQIGSIDNREGYKIFLNGGGTQTMSVEGMPADDMMISLAPYTFNLLPFLPQECMNTVDVFAGYEDQILVVKSDNGEYFVPIYDVTTLDEMCPGEGYAIFLNGANGIDFMYPMGTLASAHNSDVMDDYKSSTRRDDVAVTGESHLVLVTGMTAQDGVEIAEGDILRAYANGELVGSINIVNDHINGAPIDLVAHGSIDFSEFGGPVLDGYIKGDEINLSYYSRSTQTEYDVDYDLDVNVYGEGSEMSVGGITVLNELENPTSFKLSQNYPNPFNPTTMIEYNVEHSGLVSLKVYDIMGRLVRTLIDGEFKSAGNADGYRSQWNGLDDKGQQVSAGLYIYRLESGSMAISNKMILLK